MTLHVDPFVFWWAVLVTLALLGIPLNRWRRDITARREAEAECRRLANLVARVCEERAAAEQHAREWAALADDRGVDLVEHQHRCLGELVPNDSGVKQ